MQESEKQYHEQTKAIRSGQKRTAEREHNEPIFTTSSFIFDSAAQAARMFNEEESGNVYSRFTNPTVAGFEQRLAALEGGKHCIATSSGMAAINGVMLGLLKAGDHIVVCNELFGASVSLFNKILKKFDVRVSFVKMTTLQQWELATCYDTKLFFLETPSNPLCQIADITTISQIAHSANSLLVVDNAFCTPALQRPLQLGADIVVHSATKYLDGQGRCVGGAIVTNDDEVYDSLFSMLRTTGPTMSPFNAWTFSKGLETLPLRMQQHCSNAQAVAEWLTTHAAVEKVYYPGLTDHPQHKRAKTQQSGFGGVVSFAIKGGREEAWKVIDGVRFLSITANLGDAKTTITHPATTTHARIEQKDRDAAGITDSLIRVSVGLEHVQDIIDDLQQGLQSLA